VYGVALEKPLLLVSDGGEEVEPSSPNADLWARAERLDPCADLRSQVESALHHQDVEPMRKITERALGLPGQARKIVNGALRELMDLPVADPPRVRPVPLCRPTRGDPVSSFLVAAQVDVDGNRVSLERFPDILRGFRAPEGAETFLVVTESEVDTHVRYNAEIVVDDRVADYWDAHSWVEHALDEHLGALVACAATEFGCVLCVRGHPLWEVDGAEPVTVASAVYSWAVEDCPLAPDLRLTVDENEISTVVLLTDQRLREAPQPRGASQERTSALRGLPAAR